MIEDSDPTVRSGRTADIVAAMEDVQGWLRLKLKSGRYSFGFAYELACHQIDRFYSVHTIYDEIGILEGTDDRPSLMKAATPFRGPLLAGLWHKHHFQARFLLENLKLEAKRKKGADNIVDRAFRAHIGSFIHEAAGSIAYDLILTHLVKEQPIAS